MLEYLLTQNVVSYVRLYECFDVRLNSSLHEENKMKKQINGKFWERLLLEGSSCGSIFFRLMASTFCAVYTSPVEA
jgi:hypothetical protein